MARKFLQNDILLYLLPSQFQMQNAYLSFSFIFRRTYVMKYIDLYCLAICQWGLMLRKFLYMIKIMIKFLMTLLPKLEKHIPLPSGHCLYDFKHVTILIFFSLDRSENFLDRYIYYYHGNYGWRIGEKEALSGESEGHSFYTSTFFMN